MPQNAVFVKPDNPAQDECGILSRVIHSECGLARRPHRTLCPGFCPGSDPPQDCSQGEPPLAMSESDFRSDHSLCDTPD